MKEKTERHKWEKDSRGKHCVKCGSRINNTPGFIRYTEVDNIGTSQAVDFYPRCLFKK